MACLHPEIIYNKYTGEYVTISCGKCEACCVSKQMDYSNRVRIECEQHPYNLFFTLTYDNEHIPFITPLDCFVHSLDGRFGVEDSHDFVFDNKPFDNIVNADAFQLDGLAVLYYKDVQWFLKHVRNNLYYHFISLGYDKEKARSMAKIRYAICGEFGPDTHRPHYHGIFHFHTFEASEFVRKTIPEIWTLCNWSELERYWISRGKPQKTNPFPSYCSAGAASNYVSKYVSNFVGNNVLDSLGKFRPFFKTSRKPLYGVSEFDKEVYKKSFEEKPMAFREISYCDKSGIHSSHVLLSKRFFNSVFPKFFGFSLSNLYHTYWCLVTSSEERIRSKFIRYKTLIQNALPEMVLEKYREHDYFGCFSYQAFANYVHSMINLEISFKSYCVRSKMLRFDERDILGYLIDNWDGFLDKSVLYVQRVINNFVLSCGFSESETMGYYSTAIFTSPDYCSYAMASSLRQFVGKHYKILYGKKLSSHNQKQFCTV